MKISDLDGNVHNWKIEGSTVRLNEQIPRSSLHLKARSLLRDIYPTLQISEEVQVYLRIRKKAFLDFYINTIKTVIEVHGQQHYEFIPFYHGTRLGFAQAKKRDRDKVEWCEQNGITVIELPYSEKENEWRKRIEDR